MSDPRPVPEEFRQPQVHPLAVQQAPEAWLNPDLPSGYQEFLDLLTRIKDGWREGGQRLRWSSDGWEKHWIRIITPTMWFRWLESRSGSPRLVIYVLKKHLNKDVDGYLTSNVFNRNFPSIDQLLELDFALPVQYDIGKYWKVSWLRALTQRMIADAASGHESRLSTSKALKRGYSSSTLKQAMDRVLARLKGLYDHKRDYTSWLNEVSLEVTKVTDQESCPKLFRVIAVLLACEEMVKAGKKGNLEVAQLVRSYLPNKLELPGLFHPRDSDATHSGPPGRAIPSSITPSLPMASSVPQPRSLTRLRAPSPPPTPYASPYSLPSATSEIDSTMPPPRSRQPRRGSSSSFGSPSRSIASYASSGRGGPLRRTSTASSYTSSVFPYPQSPRSSVFTPEDRNELRTPSPFTSTSYVHSPGSVTSSLSGYVPPIPPLAMEHHELVAAVKRRYIMICGYVDEAVERLCALDRHSTIDGYLRRLSIARTMDVPMVWQLPQTLEQVEECVNADKLEYRPMVIPDVFPDVFA